MAPGKPTLVMPVRKPRLAGDERGPARGAALLGIVVGEHHAFLGDAVDVGRFEAHQSHRVGADIGSGRCRRPR